MHNVDVKCDERDQTLQDLQCYEVSGKYVATCTNTAGSNLTMECCVNQDINEVEGRSSNTSSGIL